MTRSNTYAYGTFADDADELDRLEQQAAVDPALEMGILRSFGLAQGQQVLDVGCGPGVITSLLADVVSENDADGRVVGVDVNELLLERARQRTFDHGDRVEIRVHDLTTGPVVTGAPGGFDFAYARFVFQHVADAGEVACNVRASLRPGGTFCILDVDDDWFTCWPRPAAIGRLFDLARVAQKDGGGNRNVGRRLHSTLFEAGFTDIQAGVHTVTSSDIGMAGLLHLATGYKASYVESVGDLLERKALQQAIDGAANDLGAWAALGLFWATGQVPTS